MYVKKRRLTDIGDKLEVTLVRVSNTIVEKWEVQTTGCKIGYKDILYNTGNTANIL